jgi:hypothetical protein
VTSRLGDSFGLEIVWDYLLFRRQLLIMIVERCIIFALTSVDPYKREEEVQLASEESVVRLCSPLSIYAFWGLGVVASLSVELSD